MSRLWLTSRPGSSDPMTRVDKIRVMVCVLGVFVFVVVSSLVTWAQAHDEREVWWTVACATADQPDRVCLDGTVSVDQIPSWAGGSAQG